MPCARRDVFLIAYMTSARYDFQAQKERVRARRARGKMSADVACLLSIPDAAVIFSIYAMPRYDGRLLRH